MKGISLFGGAVLSVLLASPFLLVTNGTEYVIASCPTNNPKDNIANIAHEYDCTKYYACLGNEKQLRECPFLGDNRHFFNPRLGVCDWPANVDCEQPLPALSTLRVILPVPTKCPKKESMNFTVHIAHESDCSKFYKCAYGKKILQDCPCDNDNSRLYFNKYEQVCDWPFNVDCESDPSTETPCPDIDGSTLPHPETTTPKTNPGPEEPTTTPKTDPGPEEPTTTPKTDPGPSGCKERCPNNDPPNRITPMPHVDCRKWCRCQNRKVKVFTCPADFHFSPNFKNCTTPKNAGCK